MPSDCRSSNTFNTHWRVAVVFMLLVALSACANQPAPAPSTPTVTVTATARPTRTPQPDIEAAPTLESISTRSLSGTRVHFWHPWVGETAEALRVLVDLFNHTNEWGILVETEETGGGGELFNRVREVSQAGNPPDVAVATAEQILSWRQAGIEIADLTSFVEDPNLGFSAQDVVDFELNFWQQDQQGEARLGIPALASEYFLFYNQTRAAELGFNQPPTTAEQFLQQACRAATASRQDEVAENDGTGGYLLDPSPETLMGWMSAFGGGVNGADGNYTFGRSENEAALGFLKTLMDQNCAWIGRNPEPHTYFAIRYTLFYSGSLDDLAQQQAAMQRGSSQDQWRAIPYPSADGAGVTTGQLESYAVLATGDDTRAASWLFIRWISAPERQDRLIAAARSLPLRSASVERLSGWRESQPQWGQAVALMPQLVMPPAKASWRLVRGIMQDAAQQLYQPETTREQIPAMLAQMDEFASELEQRQP